jgi:integrase
MTDLAVVSNSVAVPNVSDDVLRRVETSLLDTRAPSTRRNYTRAWTAFETYCHQHGHQALPANPHVVADYLLALENTVKADGTAAYSMAAIDGAAAAIKYVHKAHTPHPDSAGESTPLWLSPVVAGTLSAIRRRGAASGRRPRRPEDPLDLVDLRAMVTTARESATTWRTKLRERRDTAALVLGWAGAMRRSEIVSLTVGDVRRTREGWIMIVRKSKTDQDGMGQRKALPVGEHLETCGPCAYVRWLACHNAYDRMGRAGLIRLLAADRPHTQHVCAGPLPEVPAEVEVFRSVTASSDLADRAPGGQLIHTLVRRRLAAARPDLDITRYGAHSLRAGFVTEAFRTGHEPTTIMKQTGHKSVESLLNYARDNNIHVQNAATTIGM